MNHECLSEALVQAFVPDLVSEDSRFLVRGCHTLFGTALILVALIVLDIYIGVGSWWQHWNSSGVLPKTPKTTGLFALKLRYSEMMP